MLTESSSELPNTSLLRASLRWIALIAGSSFLFIGLVTGVLAVANVTSAPAARDNATSGAESPDKAKALPSPKAEQKQKS